ncbi:hypothetical protein NE567_00305 [Butyricimonas paravirosa]|nr:hypothetical protein [Butyricimonas paravirosa]MCQ4871992.1 hypothetical protein [Butyricimonas paravirosa]
MKMSNCYKKPTCFYVTAPPSSSNSYSLTNPLLPTPGDYLIDVNSPELIGPAIEKVLNRPQELMDNIRKFSDNHQHYRDGKSFARILDAVDDFIANYKGKIKRKPLNLFRKLQTRWQVKYFPFGPHYTAGKRTNTIHKYLFNK